MYAGVSIHAPTWGATLFRRMLLIKAISFNPRTHMGCDIKEGTSTAAEIFVSIHAPTWGATSLASYPEHLKQVSIHAPTWGATSIII